MTLSEDTESAAFWQFLNPPTRDMMAFPGFSLLCNPEFHQRWDFRNQEVDSSSDDAKSDSGAEPTLKKHKLVPGLVPPENNESAHSPERREGTANPEGGFGLITPNTKEASRRRRKEKLVKEEKVIKRSGVNREWRKRKHIVYDTGLMDDLQKFRESLVEELRVERENLVGWMKDEMTEKAGNCSGSLRAEKKKEEEANRVDKNLSSENRSYERKEKYAGDTAKSKGRPSGRSSRRKKKGDTASCSQALASEKRELSETVDKSKFLFLPPDHSPQLQQNSLSAGHKIPVSTVAVTENDRGESSELLGNMNHSSSHQSPQVPAPNFPTVPGEENHWLKSSLVTLQPRLPGKKVDPDEFTGYYHLLLQEAGRSSNSALTEPKSNTSLLQTVFPTLPHRDTDRGFSSTNSNPLSLQNPLGEEDDVLGLRMNGGPLRFLGFGNV
ncbi:uncharacterized protein LOC116196238 [Punica granatum]|uniref:BZIP domain-containing protein n=2 Tax=Punica granatum TaxID=22663 RepID=A0A218WGU3_PUNGR|nr:uncharacterized protein LOC116196238 [Punica granatum]OWM72057.1 hypothetical protein CDL15_Pgr017940 [Punica granatum]PKI54013.1 hypothetical protein CRG98_025624 [Punica granatum]